MQLTLLEPLRYGETYSVRLRSFVVWKILTKHHTRPAVHTSAMWRTPQSRPGSCHRTISEGRVLLHRAKVVRRTTTGPQSPPIFLSPHVARMAPSAAAP